METLNEKMGDEMRVNIYYDPSKFDLKLFDELEFSSGSYEFDTLVVWEDKEGKLLWANDYGCSCPVPFAKFKLDDLREITPENHREFEKMVKEKADEEKLADHRFIPFLVNIATSLRKK